MATYTNYKELVGEELKEGDTVDIKGYRHIVRDTYLENYQGPNDKIFDLLDPKYNKLALAEESYWYTISWWFWPSFRANDYAAATRLVLKLYKLLDWAAISEITSFKLKISWWRLVDVKIGTPYQIKTAKGQWWKCILVVQDNKLLVLSNNPDWDGGHQLSPNNAAYGLKYQWHIGRIEEIEKWKAIEWSAPQDLVWPENIQVTWPEPTPVPTTEKYHNTYIVDTVDGPLTIELDKKYHLSCSEDNGITEIMFVKQNETLLMLSNNPRWDGWNDISEENKKRGYYAWWTFGKESQYIGWKEHLMFSRRKVRILSVEPDTQNSNPVEALQNPVSETKGRLIDRLKKLPIR